MDPSVIISDFLSESKTIMSQIDIMQLDVVVNLYEMSKMVCKSACINRNNIDTQLRVDLCSNMDIILERITELAPSISRPDISIYTPSVQDFGRWGNVELMKDKGLTGYLLAKEIGGHAIMFFGTRPEDYPYISDLPGMEMIYTDSPNGNADVYYKHLKENYARIDVLILYGMYAPAIDYLNEYRKFRPDGKVYCILDMNSYWMGNIDWDSSFVKRFASQCDFMATSCKSLRDALNLNPKVSFPCYFLPNGFYNPTGLNVVADSDKKKNIILTVGRIGTVQKNNIELMIAFARVSDILEGWKLKFVGTIEPEFRSTINDYFISRPDLKERVIFTGPITNKNELYAEYAQAKIFALTSQIEGGTPNVYAEALFHGCMFITSNIDAADDIINSGELGIKYHIGNVDELSEGLVKLCSTTNNANFRTHISKALDYAKKHYDWNYNAKKLAYALLK